MASLHIPSDWTKCCLCQNATTERLQQADYHRFPNSNGYKTLHKNIPILCEFSDLPIPINPARLDEVFLKKEEACKNTTSVMKAVIQRVHRASVSVGDDVISSIGRGLCVLIGIHKNDTKQDMEYMVRKVLNTRLFEDQTGKRWQVGVKDAGLEVLSVSQFTLYCELKGNKPDYRHAMSGESAQQFYEDFMTCLRQQYKGDMVKDGKFGAMMQVHIENDGPVTITIDSPQKKSEVKDE